MKKYDITVFGATGFTGELTINYLASKVKDKPFKIAIAGRDYSKLNFMKKRIMAKFPECKDVGVVIADVTSYNSLLEMALASKIVITTVGPYLKYGEDVVKACIEGKADYLDLTGEGGFVDTIIKRYHEKAKQEKVRILNCCGFDSIPADLGTFFTVSKLPPNEPKEVECFVTVTSSIPSAMSQWNSVSGGTWHSAIGFMNFSEYLRQKESYSRIASSSISRKIFPIPFQMRYRNETGTFGAPLPFVDIEVVLRSAAALESYGPEFSYGHYAGIGSILTLVGGAFAVGTIFALAQLEITKNWLLSIKKPGDGPDEIQRQSNSFCLSFVGKSKSKTVRTEVRGGDPGYGDTAKILSEAALTLLHDPIPETYGVVTPATILGENLIKRLDSIGVTFREV
ncbi:MAG: saccharopine dehydrogenase NADP-binding domain-containing protein [Leptospiraceae bacterium]|nr:saccharopine dehydrogenase NADP-binding domain-containing protein [Leptospiraceae bacterium]